MNVRKLFFIPEQNYFICEDDIKKARALCRENDTGLYRFLSKRFITLTRTPAEPLRIFWLLQGILGKKDRIAVDPALRR